MRILYLLSDGIYGIVYYGIGYRRKVVMDNLRQAFPEKSEAERVRIAKKFYHNFIDSFVEVIKLISANESWLAQAIHGRRTGVGRRIRDGQELPDASGAYFQLGMGSDRADCADQIQDIGRVYAHWQ
jgi:KDO2-lipid IV(A) lauroyltransferase